MQDNNIKYWQKIAGFYTPFMKNNKKMYEAICREVEPILNRKMTVLELACGTGQLSFPLAPKTAHWEATDFSEQMIAEAKKKSASKKLYFSVQDATNLPYADNSFDAVMIANALHIMPEPEKALFSVSFSGFMPPEREASRSAASTSPILPTASGAPASAVWNSIFPAFPEPSLTRSPSVTRVSQPIWQRRLQNLRE